MTTTIRLIGLTILFTSAIHAAPLDEKLDAFKSALKTSSAKTDASRAAEDGFAAPLALMNPASDEEIGEANLERFVIQAMAQNPSPAVQEAGKALLDELKAMKKTRDDAFAAKVDALIKDLSDRLAKAQKPEELDSVLEDIRDVRVPYRAGYEADPALQVQANKITACYQFTTQWQDYLSAKAHGANGTAKTILDGMLQNRQPDAPMLVPRSQLLDAQAALADAAKPVGDGTAVNAQAAELQRVAALIAGIKTLDDIALAVAKINAGGTINYAGGNNDAQQLSRLSLAYSDAKNGLPAKFDFLEQRFGNETSAAQTDLSRVRAMVVMYLLPLYLNAGPDQQPQSSENLKDYLERLTSMAESKSDWLILRRVALVQQKLGYISLPPEFYAALDQETAGQYALAAQSYLLTLRSNSPNLPSKLVGDRLDAIKKDHPDDYALGEKRYQDSPFPPAVGYSRAMQSAMGSVPLGYPGFPQPAGVVPPRPAAPPTSVPVTNLPTAATGLTNAPPAIPPNPAAPTSAK